MKFIHLGDIHLGKSLGDFDMAADQKYILEQILDIMDEKEADGVLIAGDVYDKSVPSEAATNLLDFLLNSLAERKKPVFMISGNHDSDDRLNYGSSLFRSKGIYISAGYSGSMYKKTLTDEYGEITVWLLPFVKASQVRHFFPDEKIETYDDAVRAVIAHEDIDPEKRNVIVSHQFVAGKSSDPDLSGSEGPGTKSVGTVEKIGYDCFDLFDYAALGHIHSPQSVGHREVRYSGSPLKYSLSEVDNNKSLPIVTFNGKGDVDIELVPLKPLRDMRHIKGPIKKILAPENVKDTEDFIYVTLTDEDVINDAMGIIQQVYPNAVKVDYENSRTKAVENIDTESFESNKTFEELIGDFYKKMFGQEISEDEMRIMKEAAKEAKIETN